MLKCASRGVSAPGGEGGVCSWGVSVPGGVSALGECLFQGGLLGGGVCVCSQGGLCSRGGCLLPRGGSPCPGGVLPAQRPPL